MNLVRACVWTLHPGDLLGEAISFITHGPAQHFGFLRGDGETIHELYLPQVRDRKVLPAERQFIKLLDINGLTSELSAKLERQFDTVLKSGIIRYSVDDLFRILFNMDKPTGFAAGVCSQYGFWQLSMLDLPPLVRCTGDFITPRDMLITPAFVSTPENDAWSNA